MKLDADEDLAMILPIPAAQPAKDDAVKFIDLSGYTEFFQDLDRAYPQLATLSMRNSKSAVPMPKKNSITPFMPKHGKMPSSADSTGKNPTKMPANSSTTIAPKT
jgi:hypothetical protein